MTSINRKNYSFLSAVLTFASIIFVALIGCTAAALNQRPLNAAVEMQGQTSFVCSSDIGVPHWVYSSNGKSNRDTDVKSDYCSVDPENGFHFQIQMSNNTCTLIVRNATQELAGVYTCIDGSSKSERFSALLTVLEPYPTITVENQSGVFEGQTVNIVCNTSYAGPVSPAPQMAPSVYFSTSDGQVVSGASVLEKSDQVLAYFSVVAKSPMLPSFTCNIFFPIVKETKQQYASNTPNNTYSRSSPVIYVSSESDFKTDVPLLTTIDCRSGGCVENKQNASMSTDDKTDDWRSNSTNQTTDKSTGGENNDSAVTSAVEATTTSSPNGISGNESTSATDHFTNIDYRTRNYTNETNYYETEFPDRNNKRLGTNSSENSTDIESERNTNITYETTTYYQTALPSSINNISNSTYTVVDDDATTNHSDETTAHYDVDFSRWKTATLGMDRSDYATDVDDRTTTNRTSETNTHYQIDFNKNISNSADIIAGSERRTNNKTVRYETDFPTLNTTLSGTESFANSTGVDIDVEKITNNTATRGHPIVYQDWNTAIGPKTESTNFTDSGVDENGNITAGTGRVPTTDGISRNNASATRSVSNTTKYLTDNFLNSIFALNETFVKLFRNEAPHILKGSFSSLVIAVSIFLVFIY